MITNSVSALAVQVPPIQDTRVTKSSAGSVSSETSSHTPNGTNAMEVRRCTHQ